MNQMIDRERQDDFGVLDSGEDGAYGIERDLSISELVEEKDAPLRTSAGLDSLNDPRERRLERIVDQMDAVTEARCERAQADRVF